MCSILLQVVVLREFFLVVVCRRNNGGRSSNWLLSETPSEYSADLVFGSYNIGGVMINSYIIFFIRHILLLVFFLSKPGEYPLTQNATPPQRIGWRFGCVILVAASTDFASQRWGLVRSFLNNSTFKNVSSLDPSDADSSEKEAIFRHLCSSLSYSSRPVNRLWCAEDGCYKLNTELEFWVF